MFFYFFFFFSSRRRHTRLVSDWSSDVCSSDLDAVDRHSILRARDLRARDPDEECCDDQQHRVALGVPTGDAVHVLERAAIGSNGRQDPMPLPPVAALCRPCRLRFSPSATTTPPPPRAADSAPSPRTSAAPPPPGPPLLTAETSGDPRRSWRDTRPLPRPCRSAAWRSRAAPRTARR